MLWFNFWTWCHIDTETYDSEAWNIHDCWGYAISRNSCKSFSKWSFSIEKSGRSHESRQLCTFGWHVALVKMRVAETLSCHRNHSVQPRSMLVHAFAVIQVSFPFTKSVGSQPFFLRNRCRTYRTWGVPERKLKATMVKLIIHTYSRPNLFWLSLLRLLLY